MSGSQVSEQTAQARSTNRPARSHRTAAPLYRALTLDERARSLGNAAVTESDDDQGRWRLRRWTEQRPFDSKPLFARRVAAAGLDESQMVELLGERESCLRGRYTASPAWMSDVATLCATDAALAPLQLPDSVNSRSDHGFLLAAAPLLKKAQSRLNAGVMRIATRCQWDALSDPSLAEILGEEMTHAVLNHLGRTMVLELHVARLEGSVRGDSSAQRFRSFVDRFGEQAARTALFHEYPVLGRLIASTLDRYVTSRLEFLERLSADRDQVCGLLNERHERDEIVEIRSVGDAHRGGRSVLLVRFRSGLHVVYKPKPLAVDLHFQGLLSWLNERGWDAPYHICRIVDRGEYGWMEYLHPEPCRSERGVARFYRRIGGYLALLYTLGATDLHFENLIAVEEHPMLIDLETLFHPVLLGSSPDTGTARVNLEIAESVLSVGLLPERTTFAGGVDVDLSGLGARGDQLSPNQTPCWVESGTDAMRLERQRTTMSFGEHCPALNAADNKVDYSAYVDAVIDGFRDMYGTLCSHRDVLLEPNGPLSAFRDDWTRVVLRPTQSYFALHRESGHPDLLRDALDRDRHFDRLWAGVVHHPELERVVARERDDLWWGDIPIFATRPPSRDIWTSGGERITNYLSESGLQLVERRLRHLGNDDLERQLWLVRASLASAMPKRGPDANVGRLTLLGLCPLAGESAFDAAKSVGDRLARLALSDNSHASWLGEMPAGGGGWAIRPLGTDLYSGLSGVTLFLAWLGTLAGEERYLATAREGLCSIRAQIAARTGVRGIGGFGGWGSVVYTLAHLAVVLDQPELSREAEALALSEAESIGADSQLDVLGGAAGFLLALMALHRVTGSPGVLDLARRCGDRLIETARPAGPGLGWTVPGVGSQPLAGFSHGAAGIALSLLKLGEVIPNPSYRETAVLAIRYERSLFDAAVGSWRDLRSDPGGDEKLLNAWCHGAPGIGLARLAGLSSLDDAEVRFEIETAVATTIRDGFEMNHSLCHGALGNIELLLVAASTLRRTDWQTEIDAATRRIVRDLTSRGPICGSFGGVETPGFMNGLAGIGYGLLRLAHADRVPSVLLMEPPPTTGHIGR